MSFWWWAGAAIAVAVGFVVWPLLRPRQMQDPAAVGEDRAATVRALYRQRLAELDGEIAVGQLAPEARETVAAEIGAALLADYPATDPGAGPAGAAGANAPSPLLAAVLAIALVLGSIAIYVQVGEPGAPEIAGAEALLRLNPHTQAAELQDWQARLEARVADKSEDAQSWYLLGHARLALGRYPRAAEAFAVAHAIVGDDPSVDVYWLQARYLAAKGVIDDTTRGIADRLLASTPNHPLVLELLAIDAYGRGAIRQAVEFLNRALSGSLSARQRSALSASLEQARRELGDLVPSIDLRVNTAGQPPPGATLFVIARPPGGGMPYAVVRRPGVAFPLTVRLDDAVAMNPARPLSAADEIQVVVRLSLRGGAKAEPGDWQWQSSSIELGEADAPLAFAVELAAPDEKL
jgi:cytochrome c-type biogenesis protein CcmH